MFLFYLISSENAEFGAIRQRTHIILISKRLYIQMGLCAKCAPKIIAQVDVGGEG